MASFSKNLQQLNFIGFLREIMSCDGQGKNYCILLFHKIFQMVVLAKLPVQNIFSSTLIIDLKFRQNENKKILN